MLTSDALPQGLIHRHRIGNREILEGANIDGIIQKIYLVLIKTIALILKQFPQNKLRLKCKKQMRCYIQNLL